MDAETVCVSRFAFPNRVLSNKVNFCPLYLDHSFDKRSPVDIENHTRIHLKTRVLVQVQDGPEFQPADILKYFEALKHGSNTEIGQNPYVEIGSNIYQA